MTGCIACGGPVSPSSKSGECRKCSNNRINKDPALKAKRSAGMVRRNRSDPERLQYLRDHLVAARLLRKPVPLERMREIAAKGRAAMTADSKKRGAEKLSATKLAWCPPHLRGEYRALSRMTGVSAAEARQMIEDQNELEMARWRRSIGVTVEPDHVVLPELAVPAKARPQDEAFSLATRLFGVTEEEILGPCRDRPIMLARYALAVGFTRAGYTRIGVADALNRTDHSTTINMLRQADEFAKRDRDFAAKVERVAACWPEMEAAA